MYALHLLGHHAYGPKQGAIYTVDFDPKTQQAATNFVGPNLVGPSVKEASGAYKALPLQYP